VTEPQPRIVPIFDFDDLDEPDTGAGTSTGDEGRTTIRVNPAPESRRVTAFDTLAAVVGRVPTTEVPAGAPPDADPGILVHARPPEPNGSRVRLRQEAVDALDQAQADHAAALEESRRCWESVHDTERRVAQAAEDEAAALRAFELLRDGRRNAERDLRLARAAGESANQRCLATSRLLDSARIRAERL
jgi:hypothetical protein